MGNKQLNWELTTWKSYALNDVYKTISGMMYQLLFPFSSSTRINSETKDASRTQFQSQRIQFGWGRAVALLVSGYHGC